MKNSTNDLVFDIVNNILIFTYFIIVLYPLYFIVIASISDPTLVNSGEIWFYPKGITLIGYGKVFKYPDIWMGYRNTLMYTVFGALISVSLTMTAAYPLSVSNFIGKNLLTIIFTITMFISGGLIPYYFVIRNLNMLNTVWAQLIPGCLGFWSIVVVRTYYQTSIPNELKEAAFIDGCSHAWYFLHIVIPLSKPIIAVMLLFAGVGQWHSYFNALIFISNRKLYPLQNILREILIINQVDKDMLKMSGASGMQNAKTFTDQVKLIALIKYASIIITSLPLIIVYPFIQKYFVKGILIGSIKG